MPLDTAYVAPYTRLHKFNSLGYFCAFRVPQIPKANEENP
jgi:hypothetical protein